MRHSPLSLPGSLVCALLCAVSAPLCPVAARQTPQTAVTAARQTFGLRRADSARAAAPNEKAKPTERQIALHFIKPSEFMTQLAPGERADKQVVPSLLPVGLVNLSPDDTKNRLTVKGTPEAIKQVEQMVRLLDVKPRQVRLQVRILRAPVTASVSPTGEFPEGQAVTTAEVMVRNNVPMSLHTVGDGQLFRVFVTPHINGDRSITLSAELSEVSSIQPVSSIQGIQVSEVNIKNARSWTRRIKGGTPTVVASVPNEIDHAAAYYLEVTPVIQHDLEP